MRMVGFGLKCPQAHPIKFSGLRRPNWANCGTAYAVLGGCVRLWLLILYAVLATAQEDHSQHQHAVAGLGTVDFPTSCSATAQELISRGAALLHSFGYEEARLTFNDAAKADPACAMAYWGVARTWYHPIWPPPSPDELKAGAAALDRALAIDAKTGRERDYINALAVFYKDWQTVDHATRAKNYEQALGAVCDRNPSDDEAAIFHALQLVAIGYLDPTDKSYSWQKKGIEILNELLARHQDHPGVAHYIIHAVDYPPLAELGLQAARAYARIAPDSPHALHMPSHIFTRLGLWDDSIASNLASAASARKQKLAGDELHALDYLLYAYLQTGRMTEARKLTQQLPVIESGDAARYAGRYATAAIPARYWIERQQWDAAAALPLPPQTSSE